MLRFSIKPSAARGSPTRSPQPRPLSRHSCHPASANAQTPDPWVGKRPQPSPLTSGQSPLGGSPWPRPALPPSLGGGGARPGLGRSMPPTLPRPVRSQPRHTPVPEGPWPGRSCHPPVGPPGTSSAWTCAPSWPARP